MWMPLAGRSRGSESRCHTGYTGHFSLIGTYFRLSPLTPASLPAASRFQLLGFSDNACRGVSLWGDVERGKVVGRDGGEVAAGAVHRGR
jgi:hypothetical protein